MRLAVVFLRLPATLRRLPTLRYLRVYLFLTFAPLAHFLAAALNAARHLVLPLTFLPFNCRFMQT